MLKRTIMSGVLAALTLGAQGSTPNWRVYAGDPSDVPVFSRFVQALRRTAQLNPAAASQADKLLEEGAALLPGNQAGETPRKLANAQAVIAGKTWDAREELLWSLVLRPHRLVVEQSRPMIFELAQVYSVAN